MALIAADLALAAYMFAAIMFILSLRGLNRPESAKAGNFYGTALHCHRRSGRVAAVAADA